MFFLTDNNKKCIETTDDKIIFHRFYGAKELQIKYIRAAYLDENGTIKILYKKKVFSFPSSNIKWSQKEELKDLILSLNKEDIVFCRGSFNLPVFMLFYLPIAISKLFNFDSLIDIIWGAFFLFFILFVFLLTPYTSPTFIYDFKNNEIRMETYKKTKVYKPNIDNYRFSYNSSTNEYYFTPIITKKLLNLSKACIPNTFAYPPFFKEKLNELIPPQKNKR